MDSLTPTFQPAVLTYKYGCYFVNSWSKCSSRIEMTVKLNINPIWATERKQTENSLEKNKEWTSETRVKDPKIMS
jgi:hypothetical protein